MPYTELNFTHSDYQDRPIRTLVIVINHVLQKIPEAGFNFFSIAELFQQKSYVKVEQVKLIFLNVRLLL